VASRTAIRILREELSSADDPAADLLGRGIQHAHAAISRMAAEDPGKRGMGTTLTAAIVTPDGTATIVNVGDSRASVIDGGITSTRDHSHVQQLVDAGVITTEEAWRHPMNTLITQALGDLGRDPRPDFYEFNIKGKYLLLSTDGLHDYVRPARIREVVLGHGNDVGRACAHLVNTALECGSADNISVILVFFIESQNSQGH
jgi:protein phosphatase